MLSSIFHMNIRSSHFAIVATTRNGMPVSSSTQMVHAFFYWLIRFFFMIMGCKKVIFLYLKHRRGQTRTTMTVNLLKRYHPSGVFCILPACCTKYELQLQTYTVQFALIPYMIHFRHETNSAEGITSSEISVYEDTEPWYVV